MTIKLKNKKDFDHAVTYLQNQSYGFDRYNTQLLIRFPQDYRGKLAVEELTETHGIEVEETTFDLLPALA